MPYTSSMIAFEDIKKVLDQALESAKGIEVSFESDNAATRFTARAHQFRKFDRKRNAEVYAATPLHAMYNASIYDVLMLRKREKKVRIEKIVPEEIEVLPL